LGRYGDPLAWTRNSRFGKWPIAYGWPRVDRMAATRSIGFRQKSWSARQGMAQFLSRGRHPNELRPLDEQAALGPPPPPGRRRLHAIDAGSWSGKGLSANTTGRGRVVSLVAGCMGSKATPAPKRFDARPSGCRSPPIEV